MKQLNLADVTKYVENNIGKFHQKRIESLNGLQLTKVIKRKNPYLFKAKYLLSASEIVKGIADAHISSHEETIFGDWLEGFAIFINSKVYTGRKSGITGIDLEFDENGIRYIISIKSGPNWGNDSQIKKMIDNFNTARKTLKSTGGNITVVAVNGCCYGKLGQKFQYRAKGDYYKFCGQKFWEFISGSDTLFTDIIEPLAYKAKERNEEFVTSYSKKLNQFTKEFIDDFCMNNGAINWPKLVKYNSGMN